MSGLCLIKSLPVFQCLAAQFITPAAYTTMKNVWQDVWIAANPSVFSGMFHIMDQDYDSQSEVIAQLRFAEGN